MTLRADRLALFAAVLVLLGGYLAVFRPAESALADRYAQLDDARVRLDERLAGERRAAVTRDEARALASWLARSGVRDDRAVLVARFLRELATLARADGVRVTAVAAEPVATSAAIATTVAHPAVLESVPLTVALRGTYAQLTRLVRDLARGDVAAQIGVDALTTADRRSAGSPALRATVRVTLLHLPDTARARAHAAA
jgi:hypothetical protein